MPHQDGKSYAPCVAILSLGASASMSFTPHRRIVSHSLHRSVKIPLGRCSLLVFEGESYDDYLHGIDDVTGGTRISLTIRHVFGPSSTDDRDE